jgi:hypothetical protein
MYAGAAVECICTVVNLDVSASFHDFEDCYVLGGEGGGFEGSRLQGIGWRLSVNSSFVPWYHLNPDFDANPSVKL